MQTEIVQGGSTLSVLKVHKRHRWGKSHETNWDQSNQHLQPCPSVTSSSRYEQERYQRGIPVTRVSHVVKGWEVLSRHLVNSACFLTVVAELMGGAKCQVHNLVFNWAGGFWTFILWPLQILIVPQCPKCFVTFNNSRNGSGWYFAFILTWEASHKQPSFSCNVHHFPTTFTQLS